LFTVDVAAGAASDIAANASTAAAQLSQSLMVGTAGADTLTSSSALSTFIDLNAGGNDIVKLLAASNSTASAPDLIGGFNSGDKIDLSAILGNISGGAGYTSKGFADTGAGFVELKNLVLTHPTVSSTSVAFDITFDTATIDSSKIAAATIDLEYDYSKVTDGFASSPMFSGRLVWKLIQPNLSPADGGSIDQVNGQIAVVAETNSANPIIVSTATGTVLSVELLLDSSVNTFNVGLQSIAEGGATQVTTADKVTHEVSVGVDKVAGATVGGAGNLVIVSDTGSLSPVTDNQLHMLVTYDATKQVTQLSIKYDTNSAVGTTALSEIIEIDFMGDLTANLTPASLTFI
jgi:hypothetical protein